METMILPIWSQGPELNRKGWTFLMDLLLVQLAIAIILFPIMYKYLLSKRSSKEIPGPKGFPLIGSALHIKPTQIHKQFYNFAKLYGEIFKIQLFNTHTVVLNSPEIVNKAFNRDGDFFNFRPNIFIGNLIGLMDSISFRTYDKEHRYGKKAFVKSLHMYGSGVSTFETIVQAELSRLVQEIDNYNGRDFEVVALMRRSIINVVSILLIGEEATDEHVRLFTELTSGEDFFLNAATNTLLSNLPFLLHLPYYKRRLQSTRTAKRFLLDYYFQTVKDCGFNERKEGFVRGLLEDQEQVDRKEASLSDETIKNICVTDVLVAGSLTTSATLPNVILCLVNHPEYMKRLQDEIDYVIGRDRKPAVSDKHACSFTEAVILETMRYIPTGPFLLPHACKENVEFEGYHIKANTQVLANVWFIHHDEKIWGDPWTFRPDRFLDENGKLLPNNHYYRKSFLTFGTGGRKCPGMGMGTTRIFLYLATLFQKYTLIPSSDKCGTCDPRTGDFIFDLLIKPKQFYCTAKERKIGNASK